MTSLRASWRAIIGKHIPGNPNIVPRNMPGAGSRTAVAWLSNVAPKDGTVLATADQSLSRRAGDGRQGAPDMKIDTSKLIYIGNPSADNNTTSMWHTSKVKTIEDAMKYEVPMGATGGSHLLAISARDECAARHQVQDHPRLSGRQRHQPRDGARRSRGPRLATPGRRGSRRGRTGSRTRRSTSSSRSA